MADTTRSPSRDDAAGSLLDRSDRFVPRHIGPDDEDVSAMLDTLGVSSLDALIERTVPASIRLAQPIDLDRAGGTPTRGRTEHELLESLAAIASQNQVFRSFLGMGYYDTITPPVILRNVLENPGWYTQYTPYQAEISQGRLEALLNFQQMVADLTGLPLAGASLLDEATAAAEAMALCFAVAGQSDARRGFFVADDVHPQTLAVVRTRAESLGLHVVTGAADSFAQSVPDGLCGVLLQYPGTDGRIVDWRAVINAAHAASVQVVMACDLLASALLVPPGELGADVAIGSAQRFGVPMGFGGPHAGFIATKSDHARRLPGRIIGVSRDAQGNPALRMAIQTREQHIRREKATSNICTAQALLAIVASMYAVYHGPQGIRRIAARVRAYTTVFSTGVTRLGHAVVTAGPLFDTVRVRPAHNTSAAVLQAAYARKLNLRDFGDGTLGVSFDETATRDDLHALFEAFHTSGAHKPAGFTPDALLAECDLALPSWAARTSDFLTHAIFRRHHAETEMLRYINKLRNRDLSLAHSMIPLGSCTMKLNATSEMLPVTWPTIGRMHPFAPAEQTRGYQTLFADLERWLGEITGFAAVSLQPNAGSQGEYAGLLVIRAYHHDRGQPQRDVCLIPDSAHGTNPASAAIAGLKVVAVKCDVMGNVDVADLEAKAALHADKLAAMMLTYPSTHGVFEERVKDLCAIVHRHGGQVYMDGANMNAQVGLCRPGDIGADVCHLNLHKTFCIPHGGGGPGMGPIGVAAHLAPFLPTHPVSAPTHATSKSIGPVSAAGYGSPSILPIPWVYIALMGAEGLRRATQVAILNANYMAKRLEPHYPVLYKGAQGFVAHEFILDTRSFEKSAGIKAEDFAKRLMDFGFHAPTMSFPVAGTLMIEPTESESRAELDRFCDAMITIREEIRAIEEGRADKVDNVLRNAPHTAAMLAGEWKHPYTREQAAYPAAWLRDSKFWPPVARIDNTYGDRHLVCSCPPMSEYAV